MTPPSDLTTGERVAYFRRDRGLSQRELALQLHRSEGWVSQVERDIQPVERLSILQALADALTVSVADLRPDAVAEPEAQQSLRSSPLEDLRLVLTGHPALAELLHPATSDDTAPTVEALTEAVAESWRLTHASAFGAVNAQLQELLPALERAARHVQGSGQQSDVQRLRARAYQAAAAAFARQDEPDAAWLASDRAIFAAELSGAALEVIAGHFRMAHAFLLVNRFREAERLANSSIDAIGDLVTKGNAAPEVLSLYGAMHLLRAVVAGREGRRADAHRDLQDARSIALRLDVDRNDFDTEFGPTNVELHAISVAVDLGDAGEALDLAEAIDVTNLSPERQARYLLDVAHAQTQRRYLGAAIATLLAAEELAPEQIQNHHLARDVIRELLHLNGRRAPDELRDLAARAAAAT